MTLWLGRDGSVVHVEKTPRSGVLLLGPAEEVDNCVRVPTGGVLLFMNPEEAGGCMMVHDIKMVLAKSDVFWQLMLSFLPSHLQSPTYWEEKLFGRNTVSKWWRYEALQDNLQITG